MSGLADDAVAEATDRPAVPPQHPHEAIDLSLDDVVRTRGRICLATRPEAVLWVESAGDVLQVGYVDQWLAVQHDQGLGGYSSTATANGS